MQIHLSNINNAVELTLLLKHTNWYKTLPFHIEYWLFNYKFKSTAEAMKAGNQFNDIFHPLLWAFQ